MGCVESAARWDLGHLCIGRGCTCCLSAPTWPERDPLSPCFQLPCGPMVTKNLELFSFP